MKIKLLLFKIAAAASLLLIPLLFLSYTVPCIFSQDSRFFFHIVVPCLIITSMVILMVKSRPGGRPLLLIYEGANPVFGKGWVAVVYMMASLVAFAFAMGYSSQYFLAYPTKFFSRGDEVLVARLTHSYRYSYSFRGYSRLSVLPANGGDVLSFVWPTDAASGFGVGSCLKITSKNWFFGSYIEDVDLTDC